MPSIRLILQLVYNYVRSYLTDRRASATAHFVTACYRTLLGREPEPEGLAYFCDQIEQHGVSGRAAFREIAASPEYVLRQQSRLIQASPNIFSYLLLLACVRSNARRLERIAPDVPRDQVFLRAAYRVLLKREVDETGLALFGERLTKKIDTRSGILNLIRLSPEFTQVQGLALYPMLQLRLYSRVALEFIRLSLISRRWNDHRLFLRAAYRGLLGRTASEQEFRFYLDPLRRNLVTWRDVLVSIAQGSEFKRKYNLPIRPIDAIHQSRMILFQECLPPAGVVVDLGGAAHNEPKGALLMMGYRYHPQEIIIVDLPPVQRIGGQEAAEPVQQLVTEDGVKIRYLYRSMADLDPIPDASADLIVSGESIEHISEADAEVVCDHAFRILKPGGSFCLDTPNALLTRLQSPEAFIHPEHQKEYYAHEIREKLERRGFKIVDAKGVCPMPECVKQGRFDFAEMVQNIGLSDNPDDGYMFYFRALKPIQ